MRFLTRDIDFWSNLSARLSVIAERVAICMHLRFACNISLHNSNLRLIKGTDGEPIAPNTELGWLIMGPDGRKDENEVSWSVTILISSTEIDQKIANLF